MAYTELEPAYIFLLQTPLMDMTFRVYGHLQNLSFILLHETQHELLAFVQFSYVQRTLELCVVSSAF